MTMVSYAVYDLNTGEVVHLHVEPAGLATPREEILQLADPRRARSLDVVQVPRKGLPARAVRVIDGELRAAGNDVSSGAAGGAGETTEPDVERRYEVRRTGGDTRG